MSNKRQKKAKTATTATDEPTVEWQVIPGDTNTIHVFHTRGEVFGFLASQWQKFALSWTGDRTCRLGVEVRRIERHNHKR